LEAAFGTDWVEEAKSLAGRPPLDLRVNTLKAARQKVLAELSDTGAAPTAIAPHGIRIPPIVGDGRHPNVQAEPAFQKGWFEVQDEGSQIVAALAEAKPGMQVLDFCAGAGGKTLALSAAMDNRGQIYAHDAEKARLAPIFDRIRRAESRNVQVTAKPAELAAHTGQMDVVLIDAPCTGSGTWRRRPDAKWRLSAKQLEARLAEQRTILAEASRYAKPGGRLVYITCSIFDAENAAQMKAFAAANSRFRPIDHVALWHRVLPGHRDAARLDATSGIRLTPARTGTDGFYLCALERSA
jgi:16S rRNA (cytosine967-C5)-methyltransferase